MDTRPVKTTFSEEGSSAGPAANDPAKVRITTKELLAAPLGIVDVSSTLSRVPSDNLGLFILNSGDLVLIERADRVILGRQMEDAGTSISIDLTPYGGMQSGVSRRHAAILVYQDMYLLQDLGSTNGTWLNADCLPAHGSRLLKSGDIIQLGQIRMQVAFHGSTIGRTAAAIGLHSRSSASLPLRS